MVRVRVFSQLFFNRPFFFVVSQRKQPSLVQRLRFTIFGSWSKCEVYLFWGIPRFESTWKIDIKWVWFFLGIAHNFHICSTCYNNHFGSKTRWSCLSKRENKNFLTPVLPPVWSLFWMNSDLKTICIIHFSMQFENLTAISDFFFGLDSCNLSHCFCLLEFFYLYFSFSPHLNKYF